MRKWLSDIAKGTPVIPEWRGGDVALTATEFITQAAGAGKADNPQRFESHPTRKFLQFDRNRLSR